jgi:DNA primase
MTIEKADIEKIKHTYAIEDVVRGCGVVLSEQGMGARLQARCPFPHHEDSTPSFVVYRGSRTFRCFGCGIGGDVFDFLQHYHGWSFRQAFDALAGPQEISHLPAVSRASQPAGTPMAQGSHSRQGQQTQLADHRRVLTLAMACYQEELFSQQHVLTYVAGRAVSTDTARHLCLGYSDGHRFRAQLKPSPQLWREASTAGLLTNQGRDRLACRLIIPEMREQQVVYLIGRIVPPSRSRQKYLGLATKNACWATERPCAGSCSSRSWSKGSSLWREHSILC